MPATSNAPLSAVIMPVEESKAVPSPQSIVTVKSPAEAKLLASVNVPINLLLNAVPSVAFNEPAVAVMV